MIIQNNSLFLQYKIYGLRRDYPLFIIIYLRLMKKRIFTRIIFDLTETLWWLASFGYSYFYKEDRTPCIPLRNLQKEISDDVPRCATSQ